MGLSLDSLGMKFLLEKIQPPGIIENSTTSSGVTSSGSSVVMNSTRWWPSTSGRSSRPISLFLRSMKDSAKPCFRPS